MMHSAWYCNSHRWDEGLEAMSGFPFALSVSSCNCRKRLQTFGGQMRGQQADTVNLLALPREAAVSITLLGPDARLLSCLGGKAI